MPKKNIFIYFQITQGIQALDLTNSKDAQFDPNNIFHQLSK